MQGFLWSDNWGLFPGTRNGSEELRKHCISLLPSGWRCTEASATTNGVPPLNSWKHIPWAWPWGGLRIANAGNTYEVMVGKYEVLIQSSLLILIPGRKHCFKDRKMCLCPNGACHFSQRAMKYSGWGSGTQLVTFLLDCYF